MFSVECELRRLLEILNWDGSLSSQVLNFRLKKVPYLLRMVNLVKNLCVYRY